ncbi:MAG: dephospho-CoA kinase [Candidatus Sericytochromatia bacterium]|nr:dephospho-CoA kinase [Candidatus Sericytochromatia bacterium]
MRIIGLTGGIASGKTAVSDILASLGAAIIDTDMLAREVVQPGQPGLAEVVASFGPEVLQADGQLNRGALAQRVFADEEARQRLNGILHPRIRALTAERLTAARAAGHHAAAVLVVPLLFENGLETTVEESWVVDVPEALQRDRLAHRDGLTAGEVDARLASQMSRAERLARADRVILNTGDRAQLREEVLSTWRAAGLPRPTPCEEGAAH